jgi:hypothetical protein
VFGMPGGVRDDDAGDGSAIRAVAVTHAAISGETLASVAEEGPGAGGAGVSRSRLGALRDSLPRITLLVLITAQLADLATFGLAVRVLGIADEIGPLRVVYRMGGFGAVAFAKLLAVAVMIAILELYSRRTGHGRWLAIVVAVMGVFGALTNILALL